MKESTIHAIAVGLLFSAILYGAKKKQKKQTGGVSGIVKIPSDYNIPYNLIRKSDINGEFARYINDTIKLSDEGAKRVTAREIREFVDTLSPKEKAITSKWGYESDLYDKTDILNHFAPLPKEPTKEERKKRIKKGKELNPNKYTSRNAIIDSLPLCGVHYEDGFRVATDTRILLAEAWEYPKEFEGKTIVTGKIKNYNDKPTNYGEGTDIHDNHYPNWKRVVPIEQFEAKNFDYEDFERDLIEKLTEKNKITKKDDIQLYDVDLLNLAFKLKTPDGKSWAVSPNYLQRILDFIRVYPDYKIYFTNSNYYTDDMGKHPIMIKSGENFLLIMPLT